MNYNTIFENVEFSDNQPIKKLILERENYSIVRLALKKGIEVPIHVETHSAFFLVLQGHGKFSTEAGEIELEQNQYIFIKENEKRGIKALKDLILLTIKE